MRFKLGFLSIWRDLLRFKFSSQQGASLVELSICLPVIILIVGAIVDLGLALREKQGVGNVVNRAARTAARQIDITVPRGCGSEGSAGFTCTNGLASAPINVNDSVSIAAQKATCKQLEESGFAFNDWQVQTSIIRQTVNLQRILPSGGAVLVPTKEFIRVRIDNSPDHRCFLCIGAVADVNAESTFAVEGGCS